MVSDGKLPVASFGRDETHRCCDGIYDVLNDALLDLRGAGRISAEAYHRLVFPIYFRSKEELFKPLTIAASTVSRTFEIQRCESMEVPVPFVEAFRASGDTVPYAADFTCFLRAFTEPILRMAFSDQHDLDGVIVGIYTSVKEKLARTPNAYELRYVQVAALLTRR